MGIWVIASSIPRTGASLGYTALGPYLRISHPIYTVTHTPTDQPRRMGTCVQGVLTPPQPICWRELRSHSNLSLRASRQPDTFEGLGLERAFP